MVHSSSHLKWIMKVASPAIYWIDVIEVSVKRYPLNLVCNNMSKATADGIPNTISRLQRQPAVLQNMKTVARSRRYTLQGAWGILYQLQEVYYTRCKELGVYYYTSYYKEQEVYYYTSCYKEQRFTIPVARSREVYYGVWKWECATINIHFALFSSSLMAGSVTTYIGKEISITLKRENIKENI